uniref:Alkyl transferase n=1 Tax=Angiostrongylus cantonensis TaxID=6313 RepID=A0A0K0DIX3_ANGCA
MAVRNDVNKEASMWWNTARHDKAWWHSIAKAVLKSGPVLEWCYDLGVREVTVYAFSIENFKRSPDEVGGLMKLAEEKFAKLLEEKEKLEEKQISFRFFGNIALLSPRLRKLIAQIELKTKDYDNGIVNVCMPYTARDEIARAFELVRIGKEKGLLEENQISEWLLSRCLDSRQGTEPSILIRTSGEKRLSDFLLWQCSCSHIYFDDVLWPEFNYSHLCRAIISYQYHGSALQVVFMVLVAKTVFVKYTTNLFVKQIQRSQDTPEPSEEERLALQPFLDYVDKLHRMTLQKYASQELKVLE